MNVISNKSYLIRRKDRHPGLLKNIFVGKWKLRIFNHFPNVPQHNSQQEFLPFMSESPTILFNKYKIQYIKIRNSKIPADLKFSQRNKLIIQ
jgi:hypothetical protein